MLRLAPWMLAALLVLSLARTAAADAPQGRPPVPNVDLTLATTFPLFDVKETVQFTNGAGNGNSAFCLEEEGHAIVRVDHLAFGALASFEACSGVAAANGVRVAALGGYALRTPGAFRFDALAMVGGHRLYSFGVDPVGYGGPGVDVTAPFVGVRVGPSWMTTNRGVVHFVFSLWGTAEADLIARGSIVNQYTRYLDGSPTIQTVIGRTLNVGTGLSLGLVFDVVKAR